MDFLMVVKCGGRPFSDSFWSFHAILVEKETGKEGLL
jgi:hypothetical protein